MVFVKVLVKKRKIQALAITKAWICNLKGSLDDPWEMES